MSALTSRVFSIGNGEATDLENVSSMTPGDFLECVIEAVERGLRISALFAQPVANDRIRLWAILSHDSHSLILPLYTDLQGDRYLSLTPHCAQAHWFEREIFEQWGVRPEGHPWLKPIRFQRPSRENTDAGAVTGFPKIGVMDFFRVEGEEIHEVA